MFLEIDSAFPGLRRRMNDLFQCVGAQNACLNFQNDDLAAHAFEVKK